MSTNGVSISDDSDMTGCDGEKVVTMMDVLKEQEEFEEDANAVLGASDDKECTYPKGYIKRQAIYACLTCCPEAKNYNTMRAGVCLACSLNCHENHELIELYTKRNFRCDCGNPKFNSNPCSYVPIKADLNRDNNYNQNFSGLYCTCQRPYPDPESTVDDEMIQCIICEDWLHAAHLEAAVPSNEQYSEMICKGCMDKNEFLHDYSDFAVNKETDTVDVVNVSCVEEASLNVTNEDKDQQCNGASKSAETLSEENKMDVDNPDEVKPGDGSDNRQNEIPDSIETKTDDATDASEASGDLVESKDAQKQVSENEEKHHLESIDVMKPEDSENNVVNESPSIAATDIDSTKNTEKSDDKDEKLSSNDSNNKTINTESDTATANALPEIEKLTADEHTKGQEEQVNSIDKKSSIEEISDPEAKESTTEDVNNKDNEAMLNTNSIEDTKIESSENKTDNSTESEMKDNSNVEIDNKENNTNNAVDVRIEGEINEDKGTESNDKDIGTSKTNGHSEHSPTKNDSEVKTTPENKRKLSTEQSENEDVSSKKAKLDETNTCTRPRGVKRRLKGATFWPSNFREKLCTCNECITMYKDLSVLFLIDPEDTVTAYEMLGKQMIDGAASQYEKGLEALSSLDRIQQINALTEYNKMRDKLLDFLKSFKDRKEIVKEEDIKAFFAGMKPKREPDGVYFCR